MSTCDFCSEFLSMTWKIAKYAMDDVLMLMMTDKEMGR
jgi:hypothetical protein